VVGDERSQGRVRMMPLDVTDPVEMRERLRAYLFAFPDPQDLWASWVEEACEGADHAGQAFARLRSRMVQDLAKRAPHVSDNKECAAFWRLCAWLQADPGVLAARPLVPPLTRQSMASERPDS